jgi:nucleoside-diphosphate-sugar epimerase
MKKNTKIGAVALSGCTGFIGSTVMKTLIENNIEGVLLARQPVLDSGRFSTFTISSIDGQTNYKDCFEGIECVIHSAARVHVMNDFSTDPLTAFRETNTYGTLNLARQAAATGVKRFIFVSSVKVNGEMTKWNKPFNSDDDFVPDDPYGLSKYEAEQGLLALAEETGMEVVIIRSPLVYGAGVGANFAYLIKWVNRGVPSPFGAIHNKRSLVALDNLVSFIVHCIDHPKAANEVFLISDGEDVSTTELLQEVAKAFGKRSLLIPVPVWLLTLAAKLIGKEDMANRLFSSLQVDSSKARDLLGWKPVITMDEQLKKIADATK